MALFFDKETR